MDNDRQDDRNRERNGGINKGHQDEIEAQQRAIEEHQKRVDGRFRRKKRKKARGRAIIFLIVLLIIVAGSVYAVKEYLPNFEHIPVYKFFERLEEDKIYIVLEDNMLETESNPVKKDDEIYIPVDFVKEYIDKYIFWDAAANKLTITTENKVIRMKTEELTYYVNNQDMRLNFPVYNINENAYIPSSILETLYILDVSYDEKFNMTVIDFKNKGKQMGKVIRKKTDLRYDPDKKSPIEEKLLMDDILVLYEETMEYTKVRTSQGLIGYVLTKHLEKTEYIEPADILEEEPKPTNKISKKLNIVWDVISNVDANNVPSKRIAHKGLDVLSPTWFSFDEEKLNGDIINLGSESYVKWAHENGYLVWALITDNFKSKISHAVLSSTETREYVIRQLLAFVSMYNLDGINIDFEMVRKEDADYYLQFLRELAPFLREQGAVLSVDMYVPSPWSMYYNRTEVGKAVDYICVMTYDEHNKSDGKSGPVASLGFVEKGIIDTLKEVPKEKIIMGLPYYVRFWNEQEVDGEVVVNVRNVSMDLAKSIIKENDAKLLWLEDIGSSYAEYEKIENGKKVTYKVWLEDERSIEEKMKLFEKYDLAGVAGWQRGLETSGIWAIIDKYTSK